MLSMLGKHVIAEMDCGKEQEGIIVGVDVKGNRYLLVLLPKIKLKYSSWGIRGCAPLWTYIENIKDFIGYECCNCDFDSLLEIWNE